MQRDRGQQGSPEQGHSGEIENAGQDDPDSIHVSLDQHLSAHSALGGEVGDRHAPSQEPVSVYHWEDRAAFGIGTDP